MIKLLQTGMYGAAPYILKMHRLRTQVFKHLMGWPVTIIDDHFEVDQFDAPNTVYLLVLNDNHDVVGCCRLLPSSGPTMIRDIWPEYLQSIDFPQQENVWELSRFAVHGSDEMCKAGLKEVGMITAQMFCALAELSLLCGIDRIYAMHDHRIERLVARINCHAAQTSHYIEIDGIPSRVGRYDTTASLLAALREGSGITTTLVDGDTLPPALLALRNQNFPPQPDIRKAAYHASAC